MKLKFHPADEFLARRQSELRARDPNKKPYDCLMEALIELIGTPAIPLDNHPMIRRLIAEDMTRLYAVRDLRKVEAWERFLTRYEEEQTFEQVRQATQASGATPGEAEERALKALGKTITAETLRGRKRRRTKALRICPDKS